MRIKIGNLVFDSKYNKILIMLDEGEKELFENMDSRITKIVFGPEYCSEKELVTFMEGND